MEESGGEILYLDTVLHSDNAAIQVAEAADLMCSKRSPDATAWGKEEFYPRSGPCTPVLSGLVLASADFSIEAGPV